MPTPALRAFLCALSRRFRELPQLPVWRLWPPARAQHALAVFVREGFLPREFHPTNAVTLYFLCSTQSSVLRAKVFARVSLARPCNSQSEV